MKKYSFILISLVAFTVNAQVDFKASVFGCRSDGITNNTASIQTAIDLISERGGGELHFYVGRYLTGTVSLKDNVYIVLHEGATLVGVPSAYDYAAPATGAPKGLIIAEGKHNCGVVGSLANRMDTDVTGKGIIQGQGASVRKSIETQIAKGYLKGTVMEASPAIVSFANCSDVKVTGLVLQGSANDVLVFTNCTNVEASRHLMESKEVADSNGIVFSGCSNITASDNFFTITGKPLKQGAGNKKVKTVGNKTKAGLL
ncbi:MAG: hypothetical protein LBR49_03275 [Tannerella sp.]|jgi:polygalacturonase|nr:hypothetical protein [Tannerella sp.]